MACVRVCVFVCVSGKIGLVRKSSRENVLRSGLVGAQELDCPFMSFNTRNIGSNINTCNIKSCKPDLKNHYYYYFFFF